MPATRLLKPEELTERARHALRSALPTSWKPTPGLGAHARPGHWAQPVVPDLPGVGNLWQVAPGLYRSGQPTREGFLALRDLGVTSVVNLRQTVSDLPLAAGSGVAVVRVPIKSRHVAENHGMRLIRALRAVRHGLRDGKVLVHCHHGSDRTGVIMALWRILYQGWTRQQALDELIWGDFGYHPVWANIPRYLTRADLRDLRARIEA